ncbi:MAG TPA: PIN domain-containing protein [Thermoanaerobaculia bacterium]
MQVLVDANVFVSFLVERNEKQRAAAKALIDAAGDGEIEGFVTQFAVFEVTYVLQSFYGMPTSRVATLIRDLIALPGVTVVDDFPWKKVFDLWPEHLAGLADAASVAVAIANHYDAIATFDQKMIKRMQSIGLESFW